MINAGSVVPRYIVERREQVEREIEAFAATLRASAVEVPAWQIAQTIEAFARRKREQQAAWESLHE